MNATTSFTKATKDYFGVLPNQKISDFAKELKSLTDDDKREMAAELAVERGGPIEIPLSNGQKEVIWA